MPKIIVAAILSLFTLTACNTMQGAGKDVSAAGDTMSHEANQAKNGM